MIWKAKMEHLMDSTSISTSGLWMVNSDGADRMVPPITIPLVIGRARMRHHDRDRKLVEAWMLPRVLFAVTGRPSVINANH